MKSISIAIEKARLNRDYLFSRFVTIFGLLVLATFATLILHILLNAAPLLYSVKLEQQYSVEQTDQTLYPATSVKRHIGLTEIFGKLIKVDVINCSIVINEVSAIQVRRNKVLSPNCKQRVIGLIGEGKDQLAIISEQNLLIIYEFTSSSQIQLKYSFKFPESLNDIDLVQNPINVYQHQNQLFVEITESNKLTLVNFIIGSLSSPTTTVFDNIDRSYPTMGDTQLLTFRNNILTLYNKEGVEIQKLQLEGDVLQVGHSSSYLDFFVLLKTKSDEDESTSPNLIKLSMINVEGLFLLKPLFSTQVSQDFIHSDTDIIYEARHNLLMLLSKSGKVLFVNSVTGQSESQALFQTNYVQSVFYNRGSLFAISADTISSYRIENLSSMASAEILFGKNNYSGYSEADYVWQTSVSSDVQSPKYSVVPLIMGSLKASLLALIVAVPLSLGAAIYTAYFSSKKIRNTIKPVIEMLEAIPSVMIGFIAAIWLAPFAERYILSLIVFIFAFPFVLVIIAGLRGAIEYNFSFKEKPFAKSVVYFVLAVIAISLVYLIILATTVVSESDSVLANFLSGLTLSKTAVVVALALGIAVSPTIYTLIDDALFEVPEGVKQASFALGATPIQTLNRVVLVVAFPSIVAAVMLGFGRAFGETMIVLMVTGNTPIADWDLLSGLRTLTSNLAIELQEAQVNSTLYRVLFFTSALLFVFTFIINTFAAMLKKRLRSGANANG